MTDIARLPLVSGLVLGLVIAGLLVTSPAAFVGQGATFIDTTGWADEGGGAPVETTGYLRSSEDLDRVPSQFGEWNMTQDKSDEPGWQNVKETFKADALISRDYVKPGLYTPVNVFVIDSQFTRVLHSLPVSYGLEGFEQNASSTVQLNVTNATWLAEDSPNQQIPVVEGTFVKTNATTGEVEERRLVHYYWVKRQAWGVTDHLTWVGTNMRVPSDGNITPHRELLANFTTSVTAQMFTPEASDVEDTVAQALVNERPLGPVLLGASVLVPVSLVGYGLWGGPTSSTGAAGSGAGSGTAAQSPKSEAESSSSSGRPGGPSGPPPESPPDHGPPDSASRGDR